MARSSSSPFARRSGASYRARLDGFADRLRAEPTPAEALLWSRLKGSRLGVAFRCQVVLGDRNVKLYVVDFYAPAVRLVVEVDGAYHEARRSADARRDRALERLGYRVLRLTNECVERDIEGAVELVREALAVR